MVTEELVVKDRGLQSVKTTSHTVRLYPTCSLKRNPLQQFWLFTELMGAVRKLSRGHW